MNKVNNNLSVALSYESEGSRFLRLKKKKSQANKYK